MSPDEFRRHAHSLVEWMATYMETVEKYPVRANGAGDIASKLPETPPAKGEPMEQILGEFKADVIPGMTHWQHPRFFAYFPAGNSPPSILAEMLTATLGAQCMLANQPGCDRDGKPGTGLAPANDRTAGGHERRHSDSASGAILCALLTARENATDWNANEQGLGKQPKLTVYTSNQTHSATEKNVKIIGLGRENLRLIDIDENFALRPDMLEESIKADIAVALFRLVLLHPSGPLELVLSIRSNIGEICRQHKIFLHVDAWAGTAWLLETAMDAGRHRIC